MAHHNIPAGYRTVTAYLITNKVDDLRLFLTRAFLGESKVCEYDKNNKAIHGEVKIIDSWVMIGQPTAQKLVTQSQLYLYVTDVDAIYTQTIKAGGESIMPPTDQPYGDRLSAMRDPAGNTWWIASRL